MNQGAAWGGLGRPARRELSSGMEGPCISYCTELMGGPLCAANHKTAVTANKGREPGIDLEDCHVSQCNGLPAEPVCATSEVAVWKAVARCKLFGYLPDHRTSQTKGNTESHHAPHTKVQPGRSPRAMSYKADRQAAAHHQRTRKLPADCFALGSFLKTVMLRKPGRGPESSCREQRNGSEGCARCELGTCAELLRTSQGVE